VGWHFWIDYSEAEHEAEAALVPSEIGTNIRCAAMEWRRAVVPSRFRAPGNSNTL
jgi:hypothetical protein